MMADKLLTRLLSASTALSLLTPPAQAGSSGPKALPHQPFLVAQALPGEPPARSRPDAGGSAVRDPQAARRMRSGRAVNEAERSRVSSPESASRLAASAARIPPARPAADRGHRDPKSPTRPSRAAPAGAGDIEAPRQRRETPGAEAP